MSSIDKEGLIQILDQIYDMVDEEENDTIKLTILFQAAVNLMTEALYRLIDDEEIKRDMMRLFVQETLRFEKEAREVNDAQE